MPSSAVEEISSLQVPQLYQTSSIHNTYETAIEYDSSDCATDNVSASESRMQKESANANTSSADTSKSKTAFETCLDYSYDRIRQAKARICDRVRSHILAKLSISAGDSVNISGAGDGAACTCGRKQLAVDGAGQKRANMMTSTPIMKDVGYNSDFFKVIHVQKTELHDLSPRVSEYHGERYFSRQ